MNSKKLFKATIFTIITALVLSLGGAAFAADRAANSSGDIVTYLVYGDDGNYLYILH